MANVVRDPKTHPDAIIPDLSKPDPLVAFKKDDIAFVYGSKWKQRYFTRVGDDYSQGQPTANPIEGRYFDWPVGFRVGLDLSDFWKLEEPEPGKTTFTHYADGTAHKNRMQGNDFVTSVMYERGVTCFSCHDVHGTANNADLVRSATTVCLQCHGPASPNAYSVFGERLRASASSSAEIVA